MTSPAKYVHEESWLLERKDDEGVLNDGEDDFVVDGSAGVVVGVNDDDEEASYQKDTLQDEEEDAGAGFLSRSCLPSLFHRLQIGVYFALCYALNTMYNILNKQVLNVFPAPLTVGCCQLGVGALYVGTLWLLSIRERPTLLSSSPLTLSSSSSSSFSLHVIGFLHGVGQFCTMVSLASASVAFTHIVKAMEPFFSAMVSAVVLRKYMSICVYATLIPVVGGVGCACWNETSFSFLAFFMATASNLAFALQTVLSKLVMTKSLSKAATNDTTTITPELTTTESVALGNHHSCDQQTTCSESIDDTMSPVNVFGLVTWSAFLISIPIAILIEGWSCPTLWKNAISIQHSPSTSPPMLLNDVGWKWWWFSRTSFPLMRDILLSGFFHYIYNEVMYLALDNVHPVTLAVANTMKRAVIVVASVMVFHTTMSMQAILGSAIGFAGVLVYSVTIHYYEPETHTTELVTSYESSTNQALPSSTRTINKTTTDRYPT